MDTLISVSQLGTQAESPWQWAGGNWHRYWKTWLEGAINILSEVIFTEVVSQVMWSHGFIRNGLFMCEFDSVKILQVNSTCGGLRWQHGYAWKLSEIIAHKVKPPELAGWNGPDALYNDFLGNAMKTR